MPAANSPRHTGRIERRRRGVAVDGLERYLAHVHIGSPAISFRLPVPRAMAVMLGGVALRQTQKLEPDEQQDFYIILTATLTLLSLILDSVFRWPSAVTISARI